MIGRVVTMASAVAVLLSSAGCADEPETGTIRGTVMVIGGPAPGDPRPPSSAEVLIHGDGDRTYSAQVAEDGTFDQEVDPGHYTATATFDAGNDCGGPRRVSTGPGGEATLDFTCPVR